MALNCALMVWKKGVKKSYNKHEYKYTIDCLCLQAIIVSAVFYMPYCLLLMHSVLGQRNEDTRWILKGRACSTGLNTNSHILT